MIFSRLEIAAYLAVVLSLGWLLYPNEYTRGLMLRQEGDRAEAISYFRSYLARNPHHKGATLALAAAYEAAGRPEEAVAPLLAFYEHRRGDAESALAALALLDRIGLYERAAEFRWQVVSDLQAKPRVPVPQLEALLYGAYQEAAARQNDAAAKRALLQLAALDLSQGDYRERLLRLMLARGELGAALALLQETLKKNDGDERLRRLIVRIHRLRGDAGAALAELEAGLKSAPRSVGYLSDRASVNAERGAWEDAVEDYAALSRIEPRKTAWRRELAAALLKAGRIEEGTAAFEALLASAPRDKDRWWDTVFAYADNGLNAAAAAKLESYLELFPGERRAFEMLVYQYRQGGRFDAAVAALRRRLRDYPEDLKSRRSLISFLRDDERFAECVEHYAFLLSRAPADAELRPSLAYIHQKLGDERAAAAVYEAQYALFPEDGRSMDKLVSLLSKLGERDKAIRILREHFNRGAQP